MIITPESITAFLDNKSLTIRKDHPNFKIVRKAILAHEWDQLADLMDVQKAVSRWTGGKYLITEDEVLCEGKPVPKTIEDRILGFLNEGLDFEFLLKFHERLSANPSHTSVNELYDFLEHKNIPISEDGCFYAYKSVRPDFLDWYSNTIDNSVGCTPEMKRSDVDDNTDHHCSKGLHVGSLEYVGWYGGHGSKVMIVKVDPANVVSVPRDHSCQKVRVTTYEVVGLYSSPLPENHYNHKAPAWVDDEWEDDDDPVDDEWPWNDDDPRG